jgi:ASPM-SPD-2-Hydin domain-containing protein
MTQPVPARGRRRAAGAVAALVAGAVLAAAVPAWADLDPMFEMNFGDQQVHATSGVRTMTIRNDETQDALRASAQTTGDFDQTNNCAADVPPGGACQIRVTFTPGSTGKKKGMLTINENRPGSPIYITLAGTGVTHATPVVDPTPAPVPSPAPAPPPPPPPQPSPQPSAPTSVATQQPQGPFSPASDTSTPAPVTPATSQPSAPHTGGTPGAAGKKPPAPLPPPAAPAPAVPATSTPPEPVPPAPASPDARPAPEPSPTAAGTVLGSQVTTATPARPAPPTSDGAPGLLALGTIAGISGAGGIVVRRRRRR